MCPYIHFIVFTVIFSVQSTLQIDQMWWCFEQLSWVISRVLRPALNTYWVTDDLEETSNKTAYRVHSPSQQQLHGIGLHRKSESHLHWTVFPCCKDSSVHSLTDLVAHPGASDSLFPPMNYDSVYKLNDWLMDMSLCRQSLSLILTSENKEKITQETDEELVPFSSDEGLW